MLSTKLAAKANEAKAKKTLMLRNYPRGQPK
jgi:hypothetical protein